ncbi:hypothetical protein AU378_14795 [Chryseobacterium kwangjuense]|uniref:Uncharacterized protein n=1 Tax=Chryseobacterium kwangjuense TaxID=267125 RepID=A0A135W7T1_9FLAO|nr:hypothetical protein AU378_14795 [Chryseobacterium kwangjuense]
MIVELDEMNGSTFHCGDSKFSDLIIYAFGKWFFIGNESPGITRGLFRFIDPHKYKLKNK